MNSEQVDQYLSRIDVTRSDNCSYEFLATIQRNHLLNVDFNNLTIIESHEIRWNWNDVFEGVVKQKGGGVCFELNGLMHQLLVALKFDPIFVAAPHVHKRGGDTIVEHVANLVTIAGLTYVVDVSDGYFSSRIPIPMNGEIVEDTNYAYKIIGDSNLYTLQTKQDDEWKSRYTFTPDRRCMEDFISDWRNSKVEKFMRENVYLVHSTENERWAVIGRQFMHSNGRETKTTDINDSELKNIISKHFIINDRMIPSGFPI